MELENLGSNEANKLMEILKADGFQHIEDMGHFIRFQDKTGFRNFDLHGNTLGDLTVSLNLDVILAKLYFEKTRYTQSLKNHLGESDNENVEELLEELEWHLIDVSDTIKNKDWTHDMDSDIFFIVSINDINHIIINQCVYHGDMDSLEALGKAPLSLIIKDTHLSEYFQSNK